MKTLTEIEKIKQELIEVCKHNTFVDSSFTAKVNFTEGFDACLALMLEREKVAKAALKYYASGDIDWFEETGETAKEALSVLDKLK